MRTVMYASAFTRTKSFRSDTFALFKKLAPERPDTILFESKDGNGKNNTKSFLFVKNSLRIEARNNQVFLEALSDGGFKALRALSGALEDLGAVEQTDRNLRVSVARKTRSGSDTERLTARSTMDVLRLIATTWNRSEGETGDLPVFLPGLFAYDYVDEFEFLLDPKTDSLDFPGYLFFLPEEIVIVHHEQGLVEARVYVYGSCAPGSDEKAEYGKDAARLLDKIDLDTDNVDALPMGTSRRAVPRLDVQTDLNDAEYAGLVRSLKKHIDSGDVFQIVPSRTFSAPIADPLAAYGELRNLNPSPYLFFVRSRDFVLFGASPETCLKVDGKTRIVELHPIAGTRPRGRRQDGGVDPDLDNRMESDLKQSTKERAEHMMLVDLARNDVARVSSPGTRRVRKLLEVERYSHVMHMVSVVEGELKNGLDAFHAYSASMNMGTLVGAPKIEAARLLRQFEADKRGPYGGAVGYFTSSGDADLAIVIRAALVKKDRAYVRAGAGVVFDSDPAGEAEETKNKAGAVIDAIALSQVQRAKNGRASLARMPVDLNVLFIDNFDSFVFNLVDEFSKRGCRVDVWRNDIGVDRALDLALSLPAPRLVVLSPGPGTPVQSGLCMDLVRRAPADLPVFGVCLGHQAIVEALGGTVLPANEIVHGKTSLITHDNKSLFEGLPCPMTVGRYHSLAAAKVPADLKVTAHLGSLVMAVEHVSKKIAGVQFHPESVLTPEGGLFIDNVIKWAEQGKQE